MGGRLVAEHADIAVANHSRKDEDSVISAPVIFVEALVELTVGSNEKFTAQGVRAGHHLLLERDFSLDMSNGQPLTAGDVRRVVEVRSQRLFDVERVCALALDSVGVVRIHCTYQAPQYGQRRVVYPALQLVRLPCKLIALLTKLSLSTRWQQGFELMRRVKDRHCGWTN